AKRPTAAEALADIEALLPASQVDTAARAMRSRRPAVGLATVGIFAIVVAGGFVWWRTTRSATVERPTIAVLPLANLSGDTSRDYLGVGIAETLTTSLAKVPQVLVISRTNLPDAGRGADIRTVVRDVGATLVLQGSVQQEGDRLRVNAK